MPAMAGGLLLMPFSAPAQRPVICGGNCWELTDAGWKLYCRGAFGKWAFDFSDQRGLIKYLFQRSDSRCPRQFCIFTMEWERPWGFPNCHRATGRFVASCV